MVSLCLSVSLFLSPYEDMVSRRPFTSQEEIPHQNSTIAGTLSLDFQPSKLRGNAKESSNYRTVALISHASKVMLKFLQARLQQYVNRELPDVQSGFRKSRGTEIKLPTSAGSWKKQESSRKTSISALLTMPKPLTVWITINCGKF